jgi:hypothetical protein
MRALAQFKEAMHGEGERTQIPGLQTILLRDRRAGLRLRWAAAAVAALAMAAIPIYENERQRQHEAEQERADSLLLEQVNAGLSRSVPRAMTPLMGWAPAVNREAVK